MTKGTVLMVGAAGQGLVAAASTVPINDVVQIVVQVVLGIATLWKMFKKPKK